MTTEGTDMAGKRSTPEQIVTKLRQVEVLTAQGKPVAEGHRQVAGFGLTVLAGRGRRRRGRQAAQAAPLISAHDSNARALTARYWLAGTGSRRRGKRVLIWPWAERKRWAWPAGLKRFICRSRRRVGWCEFSARLFRPLCRRCSRPGIRSRFAAL